ncbi:MAG: hypothetical protein B6243_05680 [Anaerolineaceae bacterium 4572_5.2]|nr:MAG: hypothetical protein B6243_05680 [Anaerolineaceae bacterium 4572_5.2]
MARIEKDEIREERIDMEIVVDAYETKERAMGWYYYLDDTLNFPFLARCTNKRAISPLQVGDEVEVLNMAPEDECRREMFVMMRWEKDGLGVPLFRRSKGIYFDLSSNSLILGSDQAISLSFKGLESQSRLILPAPNNR